VFRIYGIPGLVRIDSNGHPIVGIGTGSDLRPGEPALQLVAINLPGLMWAVENRLFMDAWDGTRAYRKGEIVKDSSENYYLSRAEENSQPLGNMAAWLPISPRLVTGTIAFSDLAFTATVPPASLSSGTYRIDECGNALLLTVLLQFTGSSTGVTAVQITTAKAGEILNAFPAAYGGVAAEENIFGYGHVTTPSGLAAAQRADVVYSPSNLGYIEARFSSINTIRQVSMRVLMHKV
jgi:hypothetical protein